MRFKNEERRVGSQTHAQNDKESNSPGSICQSTWIHHISSQQQTRNLASGLSCVSQTQMLTFLQTGTAQTANISVQRLKVMGEPHSPAVTQKLLTRQGVNADPGDCTALLPLQTLFAFTQWGKDKACSHLFPSVIKALNITQTHSHRMHKAEMLHN